MTDTPADANDVPRPAQEAAHQPGRLREVALLFTRLGFTAFGGPPVHIAMMEEECVNRRRWLDREHFLDIVAAVNFVPGPNSTETAIHMGLTRAGVPGLRPVWHDAHWRVWRVTASRPMVSGAASLVSVTPSSFTVRVRRPGRALVLLHFTSYWSLPEGAGCVAF